MFKMPEFPLSKPAWLFAFNWLQLFWSLNETGTSELCTLSLWAVWIYLDEKNLSLYSFVYLIDLFDM